MNQNLKLIKKPSVLFSTQPQQTMDILTRQNQTVMRASRVWSSGSVAGHNAPKQWTKEKYLTIVLFGLIPTSLYLENPIVDSLLSAVLVTHIYWGLESICTDYIHGAVLPRLAFGALYGVIALTLAGLLWFNYKDIGVSKAIKKLWSL
jgi:hypothetical protein